MFERLKNYYQSVLIGQRLRRLSEEEKRLGENITCVVFSMNRAMQLHALLKSLYANCTSELDIVVLYKATTTDHVSSYRELKSEFLNTSFIEQGESFKEDLGSIFELITNTKMFFLVDDIVFINNFDMNKLKEINPRNNIFSFRLGSQLSYSYVVQKEQVLPKFRKVDEYLSWDWREGVLDWSYPLSVDGHLFDTSEMEILVNSLHYSAPNSFENALQYVKRFFLGRAGLCCSTSVIVNIPCNRVQDEVLNLSGDVNPDELLLMWKKGYQIDLESLRGYRNNSVHEIIPFHFIERAK
ncbi:hypothetical protein [Halobacteriovorax marinus]|uniref:hypothetical protein n=1 Tax=Halobacteriovorax marinus TaxID=97084 RepID=UPI003A9072F9